MSDTLFLSSLIPVLASTSWRLLVTCAMLAVAISAMTALRNAYFHPLSRHPGPKLWSTTRLFYSYYRITGQLVKKTFDFHKKYGSTVRIAPNEISYTTASAWKTVYGHRTREMPKDPLAGLSSGIIKGPDGHPIPWILQCDKPTHARLRRCMAPAFSERALREQEGCIMKHVDLLMDKLIIAHKRGPVDMESWFCWTVFDLIGDLAFGASFGCLQSERTSRYVKNMARGFDTQVKQQAIATHGLMSLRQFLLPNVGESREYNLRIATETLNNRLRSEDDRRDFFSYFIARGEKGMSEAELRMNATIIIAAGADTTASWLPGTLYHLLCRRETYRTLVNEVRSTFANENEINMLSVVGLEYLAAVIEEGLRLYPPAPTSLARKVPGPGEVIDGRFVPGGTTVGVHQYSANHMGENFHRADEFLPERWLPSAENEGSTFASDIRAACQPFSLGPRACLGMNLAYAEMRLIMTKFLWHFDVELRQESREWDEQTASLVWHRGPLMCNLNLALRH